MNMHVYAHTYPQLQYYGSELCTPHQHLKLIVFGPRAFEEVTKFK